MKKKTAGIIAGTTLLAAIGGTVGYQVADKGVQVTADGQTSTVHTFGSTVGDVLKAQGITLGEHDTVVPGARAPSTTARTSMSATAARSPSP